MVYKLQAVLGGSLYLVVPFCAVWWWAGRNEYCSCIIICMAIVFMLCVCYNCYLCSKNIFMFSN